MEIQGLTQQGGKIGMVYCVTTEAQVLTSFYKGRLYANVFEQNWFLL